MTPAAPKIAESSAGLLGDTTLRDYARKLSLFNRFAEPELRTLIASVSLRPGMRSRRATSATGSREECLARPCI
jgi:hypothetical protein